MAKNMNTIVDSMAWLNAKLDLLEHVQFLINRAEVEIKSAEESLTENPDSQWSKETFTKETAKKKALEQIAVAIADL